MIYDYRCDDCDRDFDVRKPMAQSDSPEKCPACSGTSKKRISKSSFLLKGKGWFRDGYSPAPGT